MGSHSQFRDGNACWGHLAGTASGWAENWVIATMTIAFVEFLVIVREKFDLLVKRRLARHFAPAILWVVDGETDAIVLGTPGRIIASPV
jgi:hypothetical protein